MSFPEMPEAYPKNWTTFCVEGKLESIEAFLGGEGKPLVALFSLRGALQVGCWVDSRGGIGVVIGVGIGVGVWLRLDREQAARVRRWLRLAQGGPRPAVCRIHCRVVCCGWNPPPSWKASPTPIST